MNDTLKKLDKFPSGLVFVSLLERCGNSKALSDGRLVHAHILKCGKLFDVYVANHLIQMYRQCGELEEARKVFDGLQNRNVFSWNIMLCAYSQSGRLRDAKMLFDGMPEKNLVSWNAMVTAYAQNGHTDEAKRLFDDMLFRDIVSWNAMISGYSHGGQGSESVRVFWLMLQDGCRPGRVTLITVIDACGKVRNAAAGRVFQSLADEIGFGLEVSVATALVDMYGKCLKLEAARDMFNRIPEQARNAITHTAMLAAFASNGRVEEAREMLDRFPFEKSVVEWTAMVAGYAQNGLGSEALELFLRMDLEGVSPNGVTFISALDACSSVQALKQGCLIHREVLVLGIHIDVVLGTSLLNMYVRCGWICYARWLFDGMPVRSTVTWNCLMSGHAQNGGIDRCMEILQEMHAEGCCTPNAATFLSLLFACSHSGLLAAGVGCWKTMEVDYGVQREYEHYVCFADLVARSGRVEIADELLDSTEQQNYFIFV